MVLSTDKLEFTCPAGWKNDKLESFEDCAVREFREETGIGVGDFSRLKKFCEWMHPVTLYETEWPNLAHVYYTFIDHETASAAESFEDPTGEIISVRYFSKDYMQSSYMKCSMGAIKPKHAEFVVQIMDMIREEGISKSKSKK
jgi:8-oxo-dGTP pyrophosphatase MutT (NUDIX family)